jgi:putative hydrolase of the HAD superfamily
VSFDEFDRPFRLFRIEHRLVILGEKRLHAKQPRCETSVVILPLIEKCDTMGVMIREWMVDMGGVLTLHQDKEMEREILSFLGDSHPSFDAIAPVLSGSLLDRMSCREIDEATYWKEFSRISGIPIPDLKGRSLWGMFFHPVIDQAVRGLIIRAKARGVRVVLASNTEPAHLKIHTERGDYRIFDTRYTSCRLRLVKPDLRFFQEILRREGSRRKKRCSPTTASGTVTRPHGSDPHVAIHGSTALEALLIKLGVLENEPVTEHTTLYNERVEW